MENYTYLNYCMYDGANRSNGLPSLIAILVPLMTPLSPNGTCRDYWHIQATNTLLQVTSNRTLELIGATRRPQAQTTIPWPLGAYTLL